MLFIWHLYGYEDDQPISVGQVNEFEFFKSPPEYVEADGLRVFFHGAPDRNKAERTDKLRLLILSIDHPALGSIESIETDDLDYTLKMADGWTAMLNAEETPGVVYFTKPEVAWGSGLLYELPQKLTDWRFYVGAEVAEV